MVLIMEITAAMMAYNMRGDMYGSIKANMESSMVEYEDKDGYVKDSWDFLQDRVSYHQVS